MTLYSSTHPELKHQMKMCGLLYLPATLSAGNWTFVLTGCAGQPVWMFWARKQSGPPEGIKRHSLGCPSLAE